MPVSTVVTRLSPTVSESGEFEHPVDRAQEAVQAGEDGGCHDQPKQEPGRTCLDRDQPPVREARRQHRTAEPIHEEDDSDDLKERGHHRADVASQHSEIIVKQIRYGEEDADRGGRQQCRPERDRKAAEVGGTFYGRVGLEQAVEKPPSSDQQDAGGKKREEGGCKDRVQLEPDDKPDPRRNGVVEFHTFGGKRLENLTGQCAADVVALRQLTGEQISPHFGDPAQQAAGPDGEVLSNTKKRVDVRLLGRKVLALLGHDGRLGGLVVSRYRPDLIQTRIDLGQPRPECLAAF